MFLKRKFIFYYDVSEITHPKILKESFIKYFIGNKKKKHVLLFDNDKKTYEEFGIIGELKHIKIISGRVFLKINKITKKGKHLLKSLKRIKCFNVKINMVCFFDNNYNISVENFFIDRSCVINKIKNK